MYLIKTILALALLFAPSSVEVHQGVPPHELWGFEKTTWTFTYPNSVSGRLVFNANLKRVTALWQYGQSARLQQHIATSYYPTCVIALAPTKWVVAGKTVRGATVIDLWTVQQPPVIQSLPGGDPLITNATVTQIDSMYDEATEGRDMVAMMCIKKENLNRILVQFYDSKDLYQLDLTTQTLTIVASPQANSGGLHVPDLEGRNYEQFKAREHVTYGYIYVLSAGGSSIPGIVFKDTDKDGDIDEYEDPSSAAWAANYAGPSNYVQ